MGNLIIILLFSIFITVLIATISLVCSTKAKTSNNFWKTYCKDLIILLLLSIYVSTYILEFSNINTWIDVVYSFSNQAFKFILIEIAIAILMIAINLLIRRLFFISKVKKLEPSDYFIAITAIVVFISGISLQELSSYVISTFGCVTVEQLIFDLTSPVAGMAQNQVILIVLGPVLKILIPSIIFIYLLSIRHSYKARQSKLRISYNKLAKIYLIFSLIVFLVGGINFYNRLNVKSLINQTAYNNDDFFQTHYIDPNQVDITQFEERNIIHIYLESMENTYLSKDLGGESDVNYLPNLSQFAIDNDAIIFSNTDYEFGGPTQLFGDSWSVAGMINNDAGIPLKVPVDNLGDVNSYGTNGDFLPGVVTLGDILESYGYNQAVMFGADADFGGLTTYFTEHGNYEILDYKWALNNNLIPPNYYVNWGYEDDKLWQFAADEVTNLAQEEAPFNFVLETSDTHFPDGYQGVNTPQIYDKPYANAIAYSDYCVTEFLNWAKEQDWYKNTTIIINGDHLSMDTKYFEDVDQNYKRTTLNMIINPAIDVEDESYLKNRQWTEQDYFPTILNACGYEIIGDRLGLGTSLFSGKKTYLEEYGEEYYKMLEASSQYYNSVFFTRKVEPDENTYQPIY